MITSRLKLLLDAYIDLVKLLSDATNNFKRAEIEKEVAFIRGLIKGEVDDE